MKLKIVAVVVTGLLAANVAHAAEVYNKDGNKLDLYGKVTALRYFTDDKRDDGDKTYARLGFKGETQINDQMIGFGHWEYDFKGYNDEANGSRGNKTRLAYAGLKISEFGSLDYGRNYGVGYDIGSWTDMLPEFGGDTRSQKDVFMTYRTTGVATYRNYDFFSLIEGLNFAAQYQGKMNALTMVIFMVLTTRVPMVTVSVSPQLMFMMALVSVRCIPNPIGQMRRKEPLLILSMPPVRMQNCGLQV